VVSESAIAAGVRRVEARCGEESHQFLRGEIARFGDGFAAAGEKLDAELAALGGGRTEHEKLARREEIREAVESARAEAARLSSAVGSEPATAVRDRLRVLERESASRMDALKHALAALKKAQSEAARGGLEAEMTKLAAGAHASPNGKWVVAEIQSEADADAVRDAADKLSGALKRGAAVLALRSGDRLTFVANVTPDLVAEKKLNASDLVKKVAQVTGGSGGGKPHLALAGGRDASKLDAALEEARRLLQEALA